LAQLLSRSLIFLGKRGATLSLDENPNCQSNGGQQAAGGG
jgi:hypothetical protein